MRLRLVTLALVAAVVGGGATAQTYRQGYDAFQRGAQDLAFRIWVDAAARGDTQAMIGVGTLYETGQGVIRDFNEAQRFYQLALDNGDTAAQAYLARLNNKVPQVGPTQAELAAAARVRDEAPKPFVARRRGLTLAASIGGALFRDVDIEGTTSADAEADQETGVSFAGAVGYRFGLFRTEIEVAYRRGDLDDIRFNGPSISPIIEGEIKTLSIMANGLIEFGLTERLTVNVGGGAGIARIEGDARLGLADNPAGLGTYFDVDDTVFAWQGKGGISFFVLPRLELVLDYSYFDALEVEDDSDPTDRLDIDTGNHELRGGLRWTFF